MALSDGIFEFQDDERIAEFEEMYYFKFGQFAHPEREEARQHALSTIKSSEALQNEFLVEIKKYAEEHGDEAIQMAINQGAKQGANKFIVTPALYSVLNTVVAKEVVKGTVKSTVNQAGRRGAVFAVEQTAGMAAGQGAHFAIEGSVKVAGKIGAFLPGISAAIGQALAEKISDAAGVTNHHLKNTISVAGGAAGGAAVGAMVGGPIGAAAGAAIGVVGWGIGKGIDALITSKLGFKGPNENWAFVTTGNVDDKVCIATYGSSDTLYLVTHSTEYRGSNCDQYVMSAGQGQKASFQLCAWDKDSNVIQHLNKVYHRDFIHVGKNDNNQQCLAHGKGELWGNGAGTVDVYK
jgi:hypothetical protein